MEELMEGTERTKKIERIKESGYLQHGDLKELAKQLGVHIQTVSRVVRGKENNVRVKAAITSLIQIRKVQLTEIVNNVADVNY